MTHQAEVIRKELARRAHATQRARWAIVVADSLDVDEAFELALNLPDLEERFHQLYPDWTPDSWQNYDDLAAQEIAFDKAAQAAQAVIDHGIHAFDPDHPRFKTETTP